MGCARELLNKVMLLGSYCYEAIGYEDLTDKERTIENIAAIGYEVLSDPSHTNVIGYEVLLYTESGR